MRGSIALHIHNNINSDVLVKGKISVFDIDGQNNAQHELMHLP